VLVRKLHFVYVLMALKISLTTIYKVFRWIKNCFT